MSGACSRCGEKLGLFASITCRRCVEKIHAGVLAWTQRLDHHLADRFLSIEEEADLKAYQGQLGLLDADLAGVLPRLHRAKYVSAVLNGQLPTAHPQGVMLRAGEACFLAVATALYVEVHGRQYVSETSRNWLGTGYNHHGGWVATSGMQLVGNGSFLVTSQCVRFVGPTVLTYPLDSIVGYNFFDNALELTYEGRAHREFYCMHDPELAAAVVVGAKRRSETGAVPSSGGVPYR